MAIYRPTASVAVNTALTASQAAVDSELGPHALAIQEHMTAMLGILWQRKVDAAKAATEEPAPEPPAVPE